jgi:uncharacterized membrane protein YfcA
VSELDALGFLIGLGVAVLAGFLSGLSGFGAGLVMSAYLGPLLGAKVTIPVLAIAMILTNAGRIWAFRGVVSPRHALLVLAGAVPGSFLGALLLASLSEPVADLILAIFLILSVPLRRYAARRQIGISDTGLVIGGIAVGASSGVSTGSGILLLPLLLGAGLAGPVLLATDSMVSLTLNVGRAIAFGSVGLLDWELLAFGLAIGAATVPGSRIAAWLVSRTSIRLHTLLLETLVIVVALVMAGRAVQALAYSS